MKTETRLNYSAEFKTNVVFELLRTGASVHDIAYKYHISAQSIGRWKKQIMGSAATIFAPISSQQEQKKEIKLLQKKRQLLQKKIASLCMQKETIPQQCNAFQESVHQWILPTNSRCSMKNIYLPLTS